MDLKRIFRSWMLVILLVFVLLIVVLKFTGIDQYAKAHTSQVDQAGRVRPGQVSDAERADAGDPDHHQERPEPFEAAWVGNQENQIADILQTQSNKGHAARRLQRATTRRATRC